MHLKQNELLWKPTLILNAGNHKQPSKKNFKVFERTELIPKGLLIAVFIGLVSGPIAGAILFLQDDNQQLIFVEGSSISIVTEKIDFELNEEIVIKIINSGTVPLTFNDASYGLRITGLDGVLYYLSLIHI